MFELPENLEVKSYDDQTYNDISPQIGPNSLYLYHLDALWKIHPSNEQKETKKELSENKGTENEDTETSTKSSHTTQKEILILPAKGNIASLLEHNIPFKIFLGYFRGF